MNKGLIIECEYVSKQTVPQEVNKIKKDPSEYILNIPIKEYTQYP